MAQATLIHPDTGQKRVVESGSKEAQDSFGEGYVLMGSDSQPVANSPRTPLTSTIPGSGTALNDVNAEIENVRTQLQNYANPNSFGEMVKSVGRAAFFGNKDIIDQRAALREALYGERGQKPADYTMLRPEQQQAIRTANRPGLIAGIQALNETEAARGNQITDVADRITAEGQDRRAALTESLNYLTQRRSEIEGQQQQLASENRSFAMNALSNYPSLTGMLTEQEISQINKGVLSETFMAKLQQASAEAERQGNIAQTEFTDQNGNTFLIGVDKTTGREVYRTNLGNKGTSGTGTATERQTQQFLDASGLLNPESRNLFQFLPEEYQQFFIGSVSQDFARNLNREGLQEHYDQWKNMAGYGKEATSGVPSFEELDGQSQAEIRTWQAKLKDGSASIDEVPEYIRPYLEIGNL